MSINWSSKVTKRCKCTAILSNLLGEKKEYLIILWRTHQINKQFSRSIYYSIQFTQRKNPFTLTKNPFFDRNTNMPQNLICKFHKFTNRKFKISIKWITKKVISFIHWRKNYPRGKVYHRDYILKGTLIQIWNSANISVFLQK